MIDCENLDWCCIAAVNNNRVLKQNLAASPALQCVPTQLHVERDHMTAGLAYNAGLDATNAEIIVFAHQDVYLPGDWARTLAKAVAALERYDPNWAVAGLFGITTEGKYFGRVWDSSLERELGEHFTVPQKTMSVDELTLILRRSSGLRFDPNLPDFHLYGTDIVMMAREAGLGAYIVHAPVIHNSIPVTSLFGGFTDAVSYMRRKWSNHLPITTVITRITRFGLYHRWRSIRLSGFFPNRAVKARAMAAVSPRRDPVQISQMLGYEGNRHEK